MTEALRGTLEAKHWQVTVPIGYELDGEPLVLEESLRLLPGKRATFSGQWGSRAVVAKLFLPSAEREQQAEIAGFNALQKASLPAPALLWAGGLDDGLLAVVYEKLEGAESLGAGLQGERRNAFLAATCELLARMHRAGIWQDDIHFDNFLLADGKMYIVDNASLKAVEGALSVEKSLDNLAAFIAQFPWRERQALLESPYLPLSLDIAEEKARRLLHEKTRKGWWVRTNKYLEKIYRTCTEIVVRRDGGWFLAFKRGLDESWIEQFKAAPDSVMVRAEMLKDGNSATVVRTELAGRPVIIKRYNIKSTGHRLRRLFRETRASNAWRAAHLLQMAGIRTPAPLVLLEQRRGPLRGVAYLITEDVGGDEMLDAFTQREPTEAELQDVGETFRVMRELQLCHGDLKATNFLVTDQGVQLIDLDVLHAVSSVSNFKRCHQKDRERFLRNWYAHPGVERQFKRLLIGQEPAW
ncbi:tRNA A-37 threonylcarbamoyl transferase component Bud32 [Litorivivens lipolytica]|uniref:tRNA A-37 threonylcarbamoyl transferase component Bud32 n=1 Tax=Litorivivens lipolytica TaxID=1524264 RepID=A0A7W4W4I1_9GAMM|nr:lipopolysaccharide kinase InaA family protein [Litorivivens lipolytica]MBB3047316.1 tRNA A-37 threonylcarbamoyl transferase component Bud32 [Litorivivens lipolytica]